MQANFINNTFSLGGISLNIIYNVKCQVIYRYVPIIFCFSYCRYLVDNHNTELHDAAAVLDILKEVEICMYTWLFLYVYML